MLNGKIQWFDGTSGEGMVVLEDGRSVYCHFTAIDSVDKHCWAYPNEFDQGYLSTIKGRECKVKLYENLYSVQCDKVTLI